MIRADSFRWFALCGLLLVTAAALPTHAQTGTTTGTEAGAAPLDATDAYRLAILEMKGQLSVARALVQLRAPGADYHLQQPLQAIYRNAESEFEQRGAPFTASFLEQLANVSADDPATTLATITSAANALDGSLAQTGPMNVNSALNITASLLRAAVADYAAAVTDNEVVDLPRYQSGRGLVIEAEALVRYHGGLRGRPGHEELVKAVVLIRQAWPGIIPPPIVFDPPSVEARLDEAIAVMENLR
jgi:hypothetical protein